MTTSVVERNTSIALVGLLITVAGLFVLPRLLPISLVIAIGIGVVGFVLTLYRGLRIYSLFAGVLVAWSFVDLMRFNAATQYQPDLEEPIPVPSGYGFELDPDSTNIEHRYDSEPMPPQRTQLAAVEVVDHYVKTLAPEWTMVEREESPERSSVTLREGGSSRGIGITVFVVEPVGGPTILDLRIQALLCGDDFPALPPGERCMTGLVEKLVRYPGGEPVIPSEPSRGPLREAVPVPSGYGFSLDTGLSYEQTRVYGSAPDMSIAEAERVQRAVMGYYRHALDDWIVLVTRDGYFKVREADSRDGLIIAVGIDEQATGHKVTISIGSILCPEEYWCHS